MKLVSWNVNGIRAAVGKGFYDFFKDIDADIFSLQETKLQENQVDDELKKIREYQYWNYAEKKGYSGTACFCKEKPISVTYGLGIDEHDKEGRIITLEYDKFYLVNCYTPNSKRELERLDYRMIWEDEIREYLKKLDLVKPVIYCGDLNVAHNEIDLKNPSSNHHNAGFTDQERGKMTELLSSGFTDTYRYKYPDETGKYTWWSYMFHAREKNAGWRIDYFIVSNRIADKIVDAKIHNEIMGSDHCPIELDIKL
ncbi:exodeoxyribonuclease III Xth [Clostridium sp. CAG:793]|jgi:exodeoxyribonuclease-3|nr:exodeoxyribonuclease III Xth [Clostridium sp. CAG:793]